MMDLRRRTITAIIYGAVVLGAIFAPPIVFALLLAVVTVVAASEIVALRRAGFAAALQGLVLIVGIGSLLTLRTEATLPMNFMAAGRELMRTLGYVSTRQLPNDGAVPFWLLVAVVAVWASDVAAYLVGSAIGRHRLAPRISPGKTWEGTLAGLLAAAVAVVAITALLGPALAGYEVIGLAAVAIGAGPLGLAGDLLESWVKRRAGVKDSGKFLPGHGGMLDRIDSLLTVAPFVAVAALRIPCCVPGLG